jgi:hypothetical protein
MYQNKAVSEGVEAPCPFTETITNFCPPCRMPEAVLTHTICCSFSEIFLTLLIEQGNGPNETEISDATDEKKRPLIVTSDPPAVVPRVGTTEETFGVRLNFAVKIAERLNVAMTAPEVSVKSTPRTIALAIALLAFVLRYSSTTNRPARSPLKKGSFHWLLATQLKGDVLSVAFAEAIAAELATPFTVNQHSLVDARYPTTTDSQAFCTITPDDDLVHITDAPL